VADAVIGLHEDTDMAAAPGRPGADLDAARGGAGAALEFVADHAGAAADIAFGDRAAPGAVECGKDMRLGDVLAVDVVEDAVIGFGHHRHGPEVIGCELILVAPDHPAHGAVMHH